MPKYEVIIYWSEEDKAFIAEVPELPGCAADGATRQEALANVEVVIAEWLDTARELGRPVMAVPGPVTSSQSAGCHQLIRDGHATCVTGAADIRTAGWPPCTLGSALRAMAMPVAQAPPSRRAAERRRAVALARGGPIESPHTGD